MPLTQKDIAHTPIHEQLETLLEKYDGRAAIQFDPVPKIARLQAKGYLLGTDHKLRPGLTSKSVNAPWIYVRHNEKLTCTMCQEVMFNTFNNTVSVRIFSKIDTGFTT